MTGIEDSIPVVLDVQVWSIEQAGPLGECALPGAPTKKPVN